MRNFPTKQDFVDTLNSLEANSFLSELDSSIYSGLMVPDVANNFQLRELARRSVSAAPFFNCSGPANTYSLTSLPGYVLPTAYILGMEAMFIPSSTNTGASTLAIGSLPATSIRTADGTSTVAPGALVSGRPVTVVFDGTYFRLVHVAFSGLLGTSGVSSGPLSPGGRLSLSPIESVPTQDLTGNTLYYVPHVHDYITLFDGTSWTSMQFSSISLAFTGGAGTFPADVFAYKSGTSVLLETVDWVSNTARTISLATIDGRLVKSGDPTRLYLGTIASGLLVSPMQWTGARKTVYNHYNKVPVVVEGSIPTPAWTYGTVAWRASNANTTFGQGRVELLRGLDSDAVSTTLRTQIRYVINGNGNYPSTARIGLRYNDTVGTPDVERLITFAAVLDFANSWQGSASQTDSFVAGYGGNAYRTQVSMRTAPATPGRAYFQQMEYSGQAGIFDGNYTSGIGQLGTSAFNELRSSMEM